VHLDKALKNVKAQHQAIASYGTQMPELRGKTPDVAALVAAD
jgi:hypothetical protein